MPNMSRRWMFSSQKSLVLIQTTLKNAARLFDSNKSHCVKCFWFSCCKIISLFGTKNKCPIQYASLARVLCFLLLVLAVSHKDSLWCLTRWMRCVMLPLNIDDAQQTLDQVLSSLDLSGASYRWVHMLFKWLKNSALLARELTVMLHVQSYVYPDVDTEVLLKLCIIWSQTLFN